MKNLNKKEWLLFSLILEGLIILLFIMSKNYIYKESTINILPKDLYLRQGYIDEDVYKIGETYKSLIKEFEGVCTWGPFISLNRGIYDVTITYYSDTNDNSFQLFSKSANFLSDEINFEKNKNSLETRIWSNETIKDLEFLTYYENGKLEIQSITLVNKNLQFYKDLFILIFFSLLLDIYILNIDYFKNKNKIIFVIIGITVFCSLPILFNDIPEGHDFIFHINRIEGIYENLLNNNIPSRIQPNWNYGNGYAVSVFYGELFLYLPALSMIVGFSLIESYQIFIVLLNLFTAYISYKAFKKIFKDTNVSLVLCFLYTSSLYRLADIYVRSAIGESLALTFFPLIIAGIYLLLKNDLEPKYKINNSAIIYLVIGLSGIIQSHILSIEMVALFVLIIGIIYIKKFINLRILISSIVTLILTILINLWFIVPFLEFMNEQIEINQSVSNSEASIQSAGLFLGQLLMPFQNILGISNIVSAGVYKEFVLSTGIALIIGFILFIYFCIKNKKKVLKEEKIIGILGIFSLFLTTIYFPYDKLCQTFLKKMVLSIQFPWRFLGISAIILVLSIGYLITKYYKKDSLKLILILLTFINAGLLMQEVRFNNPNIFKNYNGDNLNIGVIGGEYLPIGTKIDESSTNLLFKDLEIIHYSKDGTKIQLEYSNNTEKDNYICLPLLNYKYFKVIALDSQNYQIINSENNQVRINLPNSISGKFIVTFEEPIIWRIAEILSIIMVIFFCIFSIIIIKNNKLQQGEEMNE